MQEQILFTVKDTCALLKIGTTKLYSLIKRGEIKSIKIGGATRFERAELKRYIASLPHIASTQTNTPKPSLLLNLRTWIFLSLECSKAILILHKLYVTFMS
jgi:excisionase family DNA binding protein